MMKRPGSTGPKRSSAISSSIPLRHTQTWQLSATRFSSSGNAKIVSAPVLSASRSAEALPPKLVSRVSSLPFDFPSNRLEL